MIRGAEAVEFKSPQETEILVRLLFPADGDSIPVWEGAALNMNDATDPKDFRVESFIEHWSQSSGAERANFQSFAKELCMLIEAPEPDPTKGDCSLDSYTFERAVKFKSADGSENSGRIDLYKKGCFVLEAKQSRLEGRPKAIPGQEDSSAIPNRKVAAQLIAGGMC